MSKLLGFLRQKGFVLVLAACVVGAAATGVWAIRTVQQQLKGLGAESLPDTAGLETYPGLENKWEGDTQWQTEPGVGVSGEMEGVPQTPPAASQQPAASSSESGLQPEPSSVPPEQPAPAAAPAPSYALPVTGRLLTAFSGDELVYNQTLGDWRTHNGADYTCTKGETVFAPVSGTVTQADSTGNWGGVVTLTEADGTVWRVCGVTDYTVKPGDAVTVGQQLGIAATVDCESLLESHIHLEVIRAGKYLNPADFMG